MKQSMQKHKKLIFVSLISLILIIGGTVELIEIFTLKDLSFEINDFEVTKAEDDLIEISVELKTYNRHWKEVTVKKITGKIELNNSYVGDIYVSPFSVPGKETKLITVILTITPLQTDFSPTFSVLLDSFLTGDKVEILFEGKVYYRFLPLSFSLSLSENLFSTSFSIDLLSIKAPLNSTELEFKIALVGFPFSINITRCNFSFFSNSTEMGHLFLTKPLYLLKEKISFLNLTYVTSPEYTREAFLSILLSNHPKSNLSLEGEFDWFYYGASGTWSTNGTSGKDSLSSSNSSVEHLVQEPIISLSNVEIININQSETSDELEMMMNVTIFNSFSMSINVSEILFHSYTDKNLTIEVASASLLEGIYLEGNSTTSYVLTLIFVLNSTSNRLSVILSQGLKLMLYNKYDYLLFIDTIVVPVTYVEPWEISLLNQL